MMHKRKKQPNKKTFLLSNIKIFLFDLTITAQEQDPGVTIQKTISAHYCLVTMERAQFLELGRQNNPKNIILLFSSIVWSAYEMSYGLCIPFVSKRIY